MTTVSELCTAHNLNAKVVRAKLRRAVSSGDLKLERDSGEQWVVSAAILKLLNISEKPAKTTKSKKLPDFGAKVPKDLASGAALTKAIAKATKTSNVSKQGADPDKAAKADAFKERMAKAREAKKQAAAQAQA